MNQAVHESCLSGACVLVVVVVVDLWYDELDQVVDT
jgi:hypothetical protein